MGVAKIDAVTGEPKDFFVWHGHGLDETSGLAASGDYIAISGQFTGHLAATLADGNTKTIWNSNVGEGGIALMQISFIQIIRMPMLRQVSYEWNYLFLPFLSRAHDSAMDILSYISSP